MENALIKKFERDFEDYLRDESRKIGEADSISFPKSEEEVIHILTHLSPDKTLITAQGARTGITSGAVPQGGHILNLSRMNKITGLRYNKETDAFSLKVQPGVLLSQLREALKNKHFDIKDWDVESISALEKFRKSGVYFYSPDPTETTASIGGMVACNASGACSFKYGSTRAHIKSITIVLISGDKISVERGRERAYKGSFSLTTSSGRLIEGTVPSYNLPNIKNASGYYTKDDMDLIDLFIGSEGTLGIITEIELKLLKAPKSVYGINIFFSCEENALKFVQKIRKKTSPAAIEFFNHNALNLLRRVKETYPGFSKLSELPLHFHTAIYVEYHGDSEEEVMDMFTKCGEIIEECGGDLSNTWVSMDSQSNEALKSFRHATPEAVNTLIDEHRKAVPSLTKLGTDMAVPDSCLEEVMKLYNSSLEEAGLDSVIFGHIGNNHLHVNIIPKDMTEYNKGKELYSFWAEKVISMGGTVSAEHGIGKLKNHLLKKMFGESGIKEMAALKTLFDSENRLNRGNLF
ncbi:FAD-binding protein [Clostridium bovifaecis]|uniref:D-lactate dehydrogenase (cytochrome) n=1 Tax=Clostridium bovifaecis TaxID=2184719 RepID=A0A6I6EVI0_9CLOT|nr:FAD-binding protein [Clostridium bovifaecis]